YAIRFIRDGNYKLITNLTSDKNYYIKYMMNTDNKNLAWTTWMNASETDPQAKFRTSRIANRPPVEFYDLKKDPYELNNLADKKEYQAEIKKYDSLLKEWMKQQGDKGATMDVAFERN
ncbi:MAG: heparan N-sulfatase, partial [Sphingobacteriaceae bacterium]